MYLKQRLIGVGIYAVCAVIFFIIIPKIKGLKVHLNVYCILLALMGFFYVPLNGSDLGRVELAMHRYVNLPLSQFWTEVQHSSAPLGILYYRVIGSLGDDRLLPFVNALLTYGICFGIIKLCYKKLNIYKKDIAIVLFFFMSRGLLMMTIANIRTMLSLSIIAFAIYKVTVENKNFIKYCALLLIGALIHNVGMLAVLAYIVFYVINGAKNRNKFLTAAEAILLLVLGFRYGKNYINGAIEKGIDYLSYSQASTGYFYIWEFILSMVVLIFTIIFIRRYYIYDVSNARVYFAEKCKNYSSLMKLQTVLCLISILLLFVEFNSGLRMSWLVTILNMPMLLIIFNVENVSKNTARMKNMLLILSVILLFISCARGDICSLKFS